MKEFQVIDEENNTYGEFDSVIMACKEANKIGALVHVRDLKSGNIKEIMTKETIKYLANYKSR